jgi:hypothetical protein
MRDRKTRPDSEQRDRIPRSLAADEVSGAEVTPDELAAERVTELPDREAMSIIGIGDNVAMPINEATAINYDSDYSVAVADADQIVIIDQTNTDLDTDIVTRGKGAEK